MREALDGLDGFDAQEADPTGALKTEGEADEVSPEVDAAEEDDGPDDLDDLDAPVPESSLGGYANWWV